MARAAPTGIERTFDVDEIIVSKTDLNGRITYANEVFVRIAGYGEAELEGAPHSIVRHPDMPRVVFKTLWDTIAAGREIFAYVINSTKVGDHYWVFAHVTPTFGPNGTIIGYHSNRRVPSAQALAKIRPLYRALLDEEAKHTRKADQLVASTALLHEVLRDEGCTYDALVWALATGREAA